MTDDTKLIAGAALIVVAAAITIRDHLRIKRYAERVEVLDVEQQAYIIEDVLRRQPHVISVERIH